MDAEVNTELAVQELLITVLLTDLRMRHPELLAGVSERLETLTLSGGTPIASAVLQKWADLLVPGTGTRPGGTAG